MARTRIVSAPTTGVREVMILPFEHLDLGFTAPLDEVAMRCKAHLDEALDMVERDPEFCWTIESLWQLEQWLDRSSEADVARLQRLVKAGRVEVCAMRSNYRSGMLGAEEANRLLLPMRRIRDRLAIEFHTALQDDVPGYADFYPRVLADAGVRYFVAGINTGHGGGADVPWRDQPFRWRSRDGSGVVAWIAHDGYVGVWPWGVYDIWSEAGMSGGGEAFVESIRQLEAGGYPHRVFAVMGAVGDNARPARIAGLIRSVREWNRAGRSPRLTFATPRQFFEAVLAEAPAATLPELRGNWHGLWDARLWSPGANALGREAQRMLPAASALAATNAVRFGAPYPAKDISDGWEALGLHFEHTCGGDPGWMGVFNPLITRDTTLRQNLQTLRFAQDAESAAHRVVAAGMERLGDGVCSTGAEVVVFNPLQWSRDAVASCLLPADYRTRAFDLVDAGTSRSVPFELDAARTRISFAASDVPGFGWRRYALVDPRADVSSSTQVVAGNAIANEFYRVAVDPESGVVRSLVDLRAGRELCDGVSTASMGGLVVTPFRDFQGAGGFDVWRGQCAVRVERSGLETRIIVAREGSLWPLTVIALRQGRATGRFPTGARPRPDA